MLLIERTHTFQQGVQQERQVLNPFPQRRQPHRDHGQTKVEIATEATPIDLAFQVSVGGGDHPHVDPTGSGFSHPADLPRLQGAQQFRLQLEGHLSDFVQEHGAPMRGLECTLAFAIGSGEGAASIPEQLAFDQ